MKGSETGTQHAERQLLDGLARILRAATAKSDWVLLVVHLSRIMPAGPKAHHRRIASSVLEDVSGKSAGQLSAMANGDVALLYQPGDAGVAVSELAHRLFQADIPEPSMLVSVFPLPDAGLAALEYVRGQVTATRAALPGPEVQGSARIIAALDKMLLTATSEELMHRQTGVLIRPGQAEPMVPLYREVAMSMAVLERRLAASGQAQADPFLFSHLATQLDRRMLAALLADVPTGGPLSRGLAGAALHINVSLSGILSDQFAAFAEACRESGARDVQIAIEVPFVEVFGDTKAFVLARERLRQAGLRLVLDGVTHQALLISNPAALDADYVKLNWSPAMAQGGAALRKAVARAGADRVVLHRAESEAALSWGLRHGIMRFQGRYLDQMLGAERMRSCSKATGCELKQCVGRAATIAVMERAMCGNHRLLDASMPVGAPMVPA